ncbi:MAG TPA: hypothetical protein PK176_12480 [Acidobacteriota bacterium]|nr:hypothetical protein [Acidobacteriota bacterium]HQM64121.1 hypothetical protein [Acidobacteriota bacterium]
MRQRLIGPAVGMIVAAGLDAGFDIFMVLSNLLVRPTFDRFLPGLEHVPHSSFTPWDPLSLGLVLPVISLVFDAVICFGALQMQRARSYAWAMGAAMLSLIPCLGSPCLVLGIPFGIWAMITLMQPDIRRLFPGFNEAE